MDNLIPAGNRSSMPADLAPVNSVAARPASGTAADIRRLWSALAGRKWLIVAVTAAIAGPAAAYSFLAKPTYLSSVSMQIEPEAVKVLPYNAISDSLVKAPADFELYMKTQDQLLASPALIARTVESVKREFGSDKLPYVGQNFKSGLRTERVAGSQVVRISYESHDPRFSALAANTLAQEFIKLHLERKAETTRQATDFLQTQLVALRQKMEDAEAELARYAARHNILDAGGNRENVIRQRFGILNSQVTDAERDYITRRIEYEELQKVSRDNFPASLRTPEITTQENRMLQAEQELATLSSQFGENWPAVVRKKQELSLIRQQLADQKNAALLLARREAELRLNSARNTYEMLSRTYREQQSLVNRLNEAEIQYNTLKRDVDAGNQLYQGLLQRLKETGVSAALELANMHITDAAVPNPVPYQPRPLWNISLALLVGLSAGSVLAFFLSYMDRSMRSPAEVEGIGIPLLGWVPVLVPAKALRERSGDRKKLQRSNSILQISSGSPSQESASASPLARRDGDASEYYRSIVASLLLSKAEAPARSILVTSSVPLEGKTTMSLNLGVTLAEIGIRTLLVDADFRNPSLSRRLGAAGGKGLSIHLAGGEADIRETLIPNLCLLPAGPQPPNPVALFAALRFAELLGRLKQEFQYVLIDSPPVSSVADALLLSSKTDGVILVVRAASTPREIVVRTHDQLVRAGACVLGATLNCVNLQDPECSYYRRYYDGRYRRHSGAA